MSEILSAFAQMPSDARVWVYQSQRPLSVDECRSMKGLGDTFIANWASHGTMLNAVFEVLYDRFIILMVDERSAAAGGCSIDESTRFIGQLCDILDTDLFERLNLAYISKDGSVATVHANNLRAAFERGDLGSGTQVFNCLVVTKADLETIWLTPLNRSWAANRLGASGMFV